MSAEGGKMIQPIDERVSIERQVFQMLCVQIARRAWVPGEELPDPQDLALKIVVNPGSVKNVYESLKAAGLVEQSQAGEYVVCENASRLAQAQLRDIFRQKLTSTWKHWKESGLPSEELQALFEEVIKHCRGIQND